MGPQSLHITLCSNTNWRHVFGSALWLKLLTSDSAVSWFAICVRMREVSVSNLTPKPDLLNVYFALFFKISNLVPEMEAGKFSSLFFCLIATSFHSNL